MTPIRIKLTTTDGALYYGGLVAGTLIVDGRQIAASEIRKLELFRDSTLVGPPTPGELELVDGTAIRVPATRTGWWSQTLSYALEGTITVAVDSLATRLTIDAATLSRVDTGLQCDGVARTFLRAAFLSVMEEWITAGKIKAFSEDTVHLDEICWRMSAVLAQSDDGSAIAVRRALLDASERLALDCGLRIGDATYDSPRRRILIDLRR